MKKMLLIFKLRMVGKDLLVLMTFGQMPKLSERES